MKIPSKLSAKWVVALFLVSVIGTAAAVTVLFTHTFPAVTVVPAIIATPCLTLTPSPTSVVQGSSPNFILFNCPGGALTAAFTVQGSGALTPTVSVGGVNNPPGTTSPAPGYTQLSLVTHVAGATSCTIVGTVAGVTTGVSLPVGTATGSVAPIGSNLDYCATVVAPAPITALSTFDVQWTQA
jgi:hypothetical protein